MDNHTDAMPGNAICSRRQGNETYNLREAAAPESHQGWWPTTAILLWLLPVAVTIHYALGPWDFYPMHNDQDVTDHGLSLLAGHFNPHWFGYGYLTFVVSALASFCAFLWRYGSGDTQSLHEFLVRSMSDPVDVLVANRLVFFIILCVGLALVAVYLAKQTTKSWAPLFLFGLLLTEAVGSLRFLIKLQSIEVLWIALAFLIAERIYTQPRRGRFYAFGGVVCGCSMSTGLSGAVLVTSFGLTVVALQLAAILRGDSEFRTMARNTIVTGVALGLSYMATSPTLLFAFNEWFPGHVGRLLNPQIQAFPWDQTRTLDRHLRYIGTSSIFPGGLTLLGAAAFVLLQLHKRSLRFLLIMLYAAVGLMLFLRSPHIKDYYLFPTVIVLDIMCLLFVWEATIVASRLLVNRKSSFARAWPVPFASAAILLGAVAWGHDAKVLDRNFIHSQLTFEKDPRILTKAWIEENLPANAMLIIDGWHHFAPPVLCTNAIRNRTLWGHNRYGRQKNSAIRALSQEAWQAQAVSGTPLYECVFTGASMKGYNFKRTRWVQEIVSKRRSNVYYIIPNTSYCRAFTRKAARLTPKQRLHRDYCKRWLSGEFGPPVRQDKSPHGSLIIKVNSRLFGQALLPRSEDYQRHDQSFDRPDTSSALELAESAQLGLARF